MTTMTGHLTQREQEERVRSASDAAHVGATDLRMADVERYFNPRAGTVWPLEYCYSLLGDVVGKTVLDYGCGDGLNCVGLALRGARVYGLDLSPDLLDVARRRLAANCVPTQYAAHEIVTLLEGSAHSVPLPAQSVDVVFGIAILHHLDLALAADEVWRVLKPGGRAIFMEPLRNSAIVRGVRKLIPYQTPDVSEQERPLTDRELDQFASVFSHARSKVFLLPTTNLVNVVPALRRRFLTACYRMDALLLRRIPALRHFASIRISELWK
jgi:SAM-dependent methyltransferase